jgi:hypothetical protein
LLDSIDIAYNHGTIPNPYFSKLFIRCHAKSIEKIIQYLVSTFHKASSSRFTTSVKVEVSVSPLAPNGYFKDEPINLESTK